MQITVYNDGNYMSSIGTNTLFIGYTDYMRDERIWMFYAKKYHQNLSEGSVDLYVLRKEVRRRCE